MTDIFGTALSDFFQHQQYEPLWLQTNDDPDWEEMPLEVFFRNESELTEVEKIAITHCKGTILDIGAGAGAITLILQKKPRSNVHALEINAKACEIMHKLKVTNIIHNNIFTFNSHTKFDTLLLLMNGIGLCGKLQKLPLLLQHCKTLIKPDGQIIFDSSDVSYLYGNQLPKDHYYGEIDFTYHYKNQHSDTFHWLYIDPITMKSEAEKAGFHAEIIYQSSDHEYVMKLSLTQQT